MVDVNPISSLIDFTSSLYLGFYHPSTSLPIWKQLSTGVPSALKEAPFSAELARSIGQLTGFNSASLGTSTLHLFWDLFGLLAEKRIIIYMDSGVYPIVRWGIERAAARGVRVRTIRHHDVDALRSLLRLDARRNRRPVVVCDGFCTDCGTSAPIREYLEAARSYQGMLILDDTQALGILGMSPGQEAPYGWGGGGSLRRWNIRETDILCVSSLAKGFGVPIAVLCGSHKLVRWFNEKSETRVHTSPPSIAALSAAWHALDQNRSIGDDIRYRLSQLVCRFRKQLAAAGIKAAGASFPLQTLASISGKEAITLYRHLNRLGINSILRHEGCTTGPCLSFSITARHSQGDIDSITNILMNIYSPMHCRAIFQVN